MAVGGQFDVVDRPGPRRLAAVRDDQGPARQRPRVGDRALGLEDATAAERTAAGHRDDRPGGAVEVDPTFAVRREGAGGQDQAVVEDADEEPVGLERTAVAQGDLDGGPGLLVDHQVLDAGGRLDGEHDRPLRRGEPADPADPRAAGGLQQGRERRVERRLVRRLAADDQRPAAGEGLRRRLGGVGRVEGRPPEPEQVGPEDRARGPDQDGLRRPVGDGHLHVLEGAVGLEEPAAVLGAGVRHVDELGRQERDGAPLGPDRRLPAGRGPGRGVVEQVVAMAAPDVEDVDRVAERGRRRRPRRSGDTRRVDWA